MAKTIKKTGTTPAETRAAPAPAKKKTAAKKAAAKKSASKKTAAKKKAVAKKTPPTPTTANKAMPQRAAAGRPAAARQTPSGGRQDSRSAGGVTQPRQISAAERRHMIAEAAYLRSESRGFVSDEREDWLIAEAEVDLRLARMKLTVRD